MADYNHMLSEFMKKPKSIANVKLLLVTFASVLAAKSLKKLFRRRTWKKIFIVFVSMLFIFTFFGALEIDDKKYYPITWPKWLANWIWIPEPIPVFSVKHIPSNVY